MVHAVGDVVYFFGLDGGGYQGRIATINTDGTMNVIATWTAMLHRVVEKLVEVEQPQVDDPDTTPADAQDAEEAAADAEGPSDA